MGLSDDGDENTEQRYEDLCLDLNMDKSSKDEAREAFDRISTNYTLEGDKIHWLACALYVACRKSVIPTVGRGEIEGNCVSLTRLLRCAKLSLRQFFNKMKKWADMSNLPQEFRDKIDRLERNFAVSTVIFKKFQPIFLDIFKNPADEPPKPPRSRKQRRLPCTVTDVLKFCWTMFVQVKGNFPAISDDLVNSYHLLLCCVDWFYANALMEKRKDLLTPEFSGLPENFKSKDFKAPLDVPCILELLCQKHEGLVLEAKGIKEHWWKPYIKKLFDKKTLKGKVDNLSGILEIGSFEPNSKGINHAYEEYVLNVGDFDERIFLEDDASADIGTPAKSVAGELEKIQKRNISHQADETKSLTPSTPLTGRRYLKDKETVPVTPVSTATQSVSRLQALLSGRKTSPSDALLSVFEQCTKNPKEDILNRVKEMGEVFCTKFAQPTKDHPGSHINFARSRLQLGESLYYKTLENIMVTECDRKKTQDFTHLLEQDIFHRSLFACCLEIVIFSYNSQRIFPWIVDIFELSPYYFYKVIEVLIRAEEGLSRDVVKHLNHIEESILESLAWRFESPLWDAIKQQGNSIPTCEEVTFPSQIDKDGNSNSLQNILNSPPMHPAVRRLAGDRTVIVGNKKEMQSPTGPSAADRFSSPSPGSARRKLFSLDNKPESAAGSNTPCNTTTGNAGDVQRVVFQQTFVDGRQVLIPLQVISTPAATSTTTPAQGQSGQQSQQNTKPKRTGSLGLFFRKFYHLASVRLRDLCERLDVDGELRQQMWTCFEYCIVHHIDLMVDRHLDQIVMCAIYVMAKVTGKDRSFQDIMRCYRLQPQAQSHVYRSVLLTSRRRRTSGGSDSSRNGTSGSSSPVNGEDKEAQKKRMEQLIRSPSTLPVPQPNSQPPTPTGLAGTGTRFEFEDRGDLIKFYNSVCVNKIKNFALKFSCSNLEKGNDVPILSPLPMVRSQQQSPRRISNKHSVYISPHKTTPSTLTPHSKMLYCFNKSPAKDLKAINNMLRIGERKSTIAGKRLLTDDGDSEDTNAKRLCSDANPLTLQRMKNLITERQEANGTR